MGLYDILRAYRDESIYPMHMPGHKRRNMTGIHGSPFGLDVTEIDGMDFLHEAEGILKDAMDRASDLYRSKQSFFLINGSTCGILAAVFAGTKKGGKVLVSRNSHQSVYHAISLRELETVYLVPEYDASFGISVSISVQSVEEALSLHDDISLIILTSPTYEGVVSDVAAVCTLAHARGIPVLVDEAHGAHFGFSPNFPRHSISAGADLVVHGLHKTLPSFTQTGLLHVNGALIDPCEVKKQLSIFESSSPSYLLMAGIDSCVSLLSARSKTLFSDYWALLWDFGERMKDLKLLRVFCKGDDRMKNHPNVFDYDPGKIVVSCKNAEITGPELSALLLKRYQIETEMHMHDYILAMTSIADTPDGLYRFGDALLSIDREVRRKDSSDEIVNLPALPETSIPIYEAEASRGQFVPLDESAGEVSCEYVFAYPPGIPLLVPGEILSRELIDRLDGMTKAGLSVKSTYGKIPMEIKLVSRGSREPRIHKNNLNIRK